MLIQAVDSKSKLLSPRVGLKQVFTNQTKPYML